MFPAATLYRNVIRSPQRAGSSSVLIYLHNYLALFQRNDPFAMLLHPLGSAGLLMRSRPEWLKGLGAEVTRSLGKEEASAGSRQTPSWAVGMAEKQPRMAAAHSRSLSWDWGDRELPRARAE